MHGKTTTTWDIILFLNVINGPFILHCKELPRLRFCLAIFISIAKHFQHILALNIKLFIFTYLLIIQTFLRIYSNIHSNSTLKKPIKYCCRRFFIVHRIPFILPMLGSISSLFDFNEQANITNTNKIQSISLSRFVNGFRTNKC
ncbi:unnamed protein product [Adineta steineri]|uniref:Protein UNC80 C-terminal domain-containing protein n=1 Tax=Adineta steineri TaxID=433720 RepID=A0A815V559_9BILA|nr:unnamed protein product [Adineta steineri]CAF4177278.1 unnamed protein product [Adineta steineri]